MADTPRRPSAAAVIGRDQELADPRRSRSEPRSGATDRSRRGWSRHRQDTPRQRGCLVAPGHRRQGRGVDSHGGCLAGASVGPDPRGRRAGNGIGRRATSRGKSAAV